MSASIARSLRLSHKGILTQFLYGELTCSMNTKEAVSTE